MKVKVKTILRWTDPDGIVHEPGEIAEVDRKTVFDLDDLAKDGTVELQHNPAATPVKPDSKGSVTDANPG